MSPGAEQFKLNQENLAPLQGKLAAEKPQTPEEKAKADAELARKRSDDLLKATNDTIGKYNDDLKTLPRELGTQFRTEVGNYFQTAINSFDANGVAGLSNNEFSKFKNHAVEKLTSNLSAFGGDMADAKEKNDKAKQETTAAQKKIENDAKTLDQAQKELESQEIDLKGIVNLDPEALAKIEDPKVLMQQLQTQEANFNRLQQSQAQFQELTQKTVLVHEKAMKEMPVFSETTNATAATAGAAAGAAIGSLFFGIGAAPGALIGAAVGAIGYGLTKAAYGEMIREKREQIAQKANSMIEKARTTFKTKQTEFQTIAGKFQADGNMLAKGTEPIRAAVQKKNERELAVVKNASGEAATEFAKRQEEAQKIDIALSELGLKRADMVKRSDELKIQRDQVSDGRMNVEDAKKKIDENNNGIDASIATMKERLPLEKDPTRASELQKRLALLEENKKSVETKKEQVADAGADIETATEQLKAGENETTAMLTNMDQQALRLVGTSGTLEQAITGLETHRGTLATTEKEVLTTNAAREAELNTVSLQISDKVLETNIATTQGTLSVEAQGKSLNGLPRVEVPSSMNAFSESFEGLGKGIKFVINDTIVAGIDNASKWLKESVKDIPVLNVVVPALASATLDLPSGLIAGAGEMAEGVATLIAHPIDTVSGLSALATSEGREAMLNALISKEEFEAGNYGKAFGKIGFNVLTTATGLGAAGTGAKAASLAYKVSLASGKSVLRASTKAAMVGTKIAVVEGVRGMAKLPGEILSTTGKILKAPASVAKSIRLGKAGRLEARIADTGAAISQSAEVSTKILNDLPPSLRGRSSEMLKNLTGDDLLALGITDSAKIESLLKLRTAVQATERLQATLNTLKLKAVDPKLTKAATLKGQALDDFIDDWNKNSTLDPGTGDVLLATRDSVLIVDGNGKIRVLRDPSRIADFANEAAMVRGISPIEVHLEIEKSRLGRRLTDAEEKLIIAKNQQTARGANDVLEAKVDGGTSGSAGSGRILDDSSGVAPADAEQAVATLDDVDNTSVLDDIGKRPDAGDTVIAGAGDTVIETTSPNKLRGAIGKAQRELNDFAEKIDTRTFSPEFRAKFDEWKQGKGESFTREELLKESPAAKKQIMELFLKRKELKNARVAYAKELGLQPGQKCMLRGERGWTFQKIDEGGNLLFEKDGVTQRIRPEKQTATIETAPKKQPTAPETAQTQTPDQTAPQNVPATPDSTPTIDTASAEVRMEIKKIKSELRDIQKGIADRIADPKQAGRYSPEFVQKFEAWQNGTGDLDGASIATELKRFPSGGAPELEALQRSGRELSAAQKKNPVTGKTPTEKSAAANPSEKVERAVSSTVSEEGLPFKKILENDPELQRMRDTILKLEDTPEGLAKRYEAAEFILDMGPDGLSPIQRRAIKEAHEVPMADPSKGYSPAELKQKMEILVEHDTFGPLDADKLLRMGVCGSPPPPPRLPLKNIGPNRVPPPPPVPARRMNQPSTGPSISTAPNKPLAAPPSAPKLAPRPSVTPEFANALKTAMDRTGVDVPMPAPMQAALSDIIRTGDVEILVHTPLPDSNLGIGFSRLGNEKAVARTKGMDSRRIPQMTSRADSLDGRGADVRNFARKNNGADAAGETLILQPSTADGKMILQYSYSSEGYLDGAGRPGSQFGVQLRLDPSEATRVYELLKQHPEQVRVFMVDAASTVQDFDNVWKNRTPNYATAPKRQLTITRFDENGGMPELSSYSGEGNQLTKIDPPDKVRSLMEGANKRSAEYVRSQATKAQLESVLSGQGIDVKDLERSIGMQLSGNNSKLLLQVLATPPASGIFGKSYKPWMKVMTDGGVSPEVAKKTVNYLKSRVR